MTGIVFEKLKFLDLTACNMLSATPDLSAFPNLEKLVLDDCANLVKIHGSMASLSRLVVWSMRNCRNLVELPDDIMSGLASLERLNLMNCTKLRGPISTKLTARLVAADFTNCPVVFKE